MAILGHLEPKSVFSFFEQMCEIPHGSGNTKAISDWCVAFAKERGLEYYQDEYNDVIIIKEATPGYENAEPVIIQGHLDMVCEKSADCTKDMEKEGLDLAIDGDMIYAKGTTLGGDDGIAVAIALALLDADDIAHPRLEAVFTIDEETGMTGAQMIDVSPLKGRRMLNIDSENEGVFTVSCAGGNRTNCTVPVNRAAFDGTVMTITVSGLQGGHSGVEIHKGRGSANMLLGRVLYEISQNTEIRLISVSGGMKDNAIPREAAAVAAVADAAAVQAVCAAMEATLKNEYSVVDPDVVVTAVEAKAETDQVAAEMLPMDEISTDRIICMLNCVPNGVQAMSADIEGLVQTSLNLGILTTFENKVTASFSIRSSVETQKKMLSNRLMCLMKQLNGSAEVGSDYPGWQYRQESPLRDLMTEVYRDLYGKEPKIEAIHAGLECGMFAGKLPGLDCVSIGPDMQDIHTDSERLFIGSTQRTWKMVVELLKRMK